MATPWRKILTSKAVWAIFLTQCGHNWGFWTFLTEIPAYMSHVMNFNIKSNSVLSALPYFVLWVLSFVFSVIADLLINKKIVSVGVSRKLFNTIGLVVPAIALLCLGSTGPDETDKAVTLLVIAVGINSAVFCGFNVNHMDISPNFTGTLMGITNGASNVFGIVAPLLVQFLVTDEKDPNEWKVIFYLTATIYVLSSLIFIIFGSGEVQPWNDEEAAKGDASEDKQVKCTTNTILIVLDLACLVHVFIPLQMPLCTLVTLEWGAFPNLSIVPIYPHKKKKPKHNL